VVIVEFVFLLIDCEGGIDLPSAYLFQGPTSSAVVYLNDVFSEQGVVGSRSMMIWFKSSLTSTKRQKKRRRFGRLPIHGVFKLSSLDAYCRLVVGATCLIGRHRKRARLHRLIGAGLGCVPVRSTDSWLASGELGSRGRF